ncbi:MAG: hypothetical protein LBC51_05215 [Treponema sp.]|nr:hypothetical protein [Treponema sp.]
MLYMVLSAAVIMGGQFLFPQELPPLPIYTRDWYLTQGFLSFFPLFPALAMSGLMIPYGLPAKPQPGQPFFRFLESFWGPMATAIGATVVYGILFFLVFPQAREFEGYLRSQGQLFTLSKERAQIHAGMGAWPEVNHFISLCEGIWPDSPEMEGLRAEAAIHMEEWESAQAQARREATAEYRQRFQEELPLAADVPEQRKPVNAQEALAMAAKSLREERYYDAHWLALLAARIAPQNSLPYTQGLRIAKQAWDVLGRMEPHAQERYLYGLYHQKLAGYEAMLQGDWVRAYYLCRELTEKTPEDPDLVHFLTRIDQGLKETAFFTDEIESSVGQALTGTMFSLPLKDRSGRMLVRIPWLYTFASVSYGLDLELMALDGDGALLYQLTAPYVKVVPRHEDSGPQLILMLHALDRVEMSRQYQAQWTGPDQSHAGDSKLILDLGYEDFLFLSKLRAGVDSLLIQDLFNAVQTIGSYGYIPQVFQAEIVYRLSEPALFLPIAIFSILIGWRYRCRRWSLSLLPMLGLLPMICQGIVLFYRSILNTLGIWSVISLGFPLSLALFIFGPIAALVFSLIPLAVQPSSAGPALNASPQRR